jgi:hypothetical protein
MRVFKVGAATGETMGQVLQCAMGLPHPSAAKGMVVLGAGGGTFASGSDAGAVVYTAEHKVVGMVVSGGTHPAALVVPWHAVERECGVSLTRS